MYKLGLVALAIFGFALWAPPAFAGTTAPPTLTITPTSGTPIAVSVFDKWTDGATVSVGDLGTDGTPEIVVGAGPGSVPEIRVLRQDGTLISKFNAFDETIGKGVIVGVLDADNDGKNDIVAGLGPKLGKSVRVFDGYGTLTHDWFPIPTAFTSALTAATIEDALSVTVPAPHFINGTEADGKKIIVDLSDQRLYAYEKGALTTTFLVSTGIKKFATKPGTYSVLHKIPLMNYRGNYGAGSPYNYFLKNVHWNLQFAGNQLIHEAYWHKNFGVEMSHGCINARLTDAKTLYDWATVGTPVIVQS